MSKCKTKAIQTDLGKFRYNRPYPGIIQPYSGIFGTLCNPGIEPWYIQNPDVFRYRKHIQNPGIFTTPIYSELWHIQNLRHIQNPFAKIVNAKIVNGYNYFHKLSLFLQYNLAVFSTS